MSGGGLVVRIARADGSVTFRGWRLSPAQAEKEAQAWRDTFPTYRAEVLEVAACGEELRAWQAATRHGGSWWPAVELEGAGR